MSAALVFSKGLRNEFEKALVNEPPVFRPIYFEKLSYTNIQNKQSGFGRKSIVML